VSATFAITFSFSKIGLKNTLVTWSGQSDEKFKAIVTLFWGPNKTILEILIKKQLEQ